MSLDKIRKELIEEKLEHNYSETYMVENIFNLLEHDIFSFKEECNSNYLLKTIPYLYKLTEECNQIEQKDYYERLLKIRYHRGKH